MSWALAGWEIDAARIELFNANHLVNTEASVVFTHVGTARAKNYRHLGDSDISDSCYFSH